ncbi:hypothetical protein L208DRAFT_1408728 [Tricholoma matsutake]|nr:hypothetical protein L208DRAFT_1408728 [Tricholoma matsutake 945]
MYIASTINPLTKSLEDLPVLVLCYNQTRRFIARPKNYTDLVRVTSEKLALSPGTVPIFQIKTLDICRGHSIEVDESVYEVMSTALDELAVVADVVKHEEGTKSLQTQKAKTQAPPTPPSSQREEHPKGKDAIRNGTAREGEKTSEIYPRDRESPLNKALTLFDNEVVFEEEPEKEEPEVEAREEEELNDEWQENALGSGSNEKTPPEELEDISHSSLKKTLDGPKNTSRKSISVTVSSKLPTPGPSNSSLHSISSPSVEVKPDPEARFNVIIRGPGPDQEAEFKTRGKHLVKKVLAGACKTFQLDFAKAHLIVPKMVNGNVDYFDCPLDQTMARCGVESGKRYFIDMDEVDELQDD